MRHASKRQNKRRRMSALTRAATEEPRVAHWFVDAHRVFHQFEDPQIVRKVREPPLLVVPVPASHGPIVSSESRVGALSANSISTARGL